MKTKELEFGFSYTKQLPGEFGPFIKASYRKVVELAPNDIDTVVREALSDDVIDFVISKVLEVENA